MYKQYYNAYEKRAEEIRKAARSVEKHGKVEVPLQASPSKETVKSQIPHSQPSSFLGRFAGDDILLVGLILLLMSGEEKDMTLIAILGYLFITGLE